MSKKLWGLFQLSYFKRMPEAEALKRPCVCPVLSGCSPHSNAIRTNISCAGQLKFHCGPLIYFLIKYDNLNII